MLAFINKNARKFFIATLVSLPLISFAGEPERQAAHELLNVMSFEKTLDDSMNASVESLFQMNPELKNKEVAIRNFFEKTLNAETFREEMVAMYSDIFSAEELQDMIAFYKTATGNKMISKLPEITQRSAQLVQGRIFEQIQELEKIISQ